MSDFLVSIVTICYNNSSNIKDTIESVVNQSYQNIEYIIIDGGSTDNSIEIIYKYKDFISVLISEPDKNLYDAINKGLRKATGHIVGLIHAGDRLFDSSVIEQIVSYFKENDIDVLYGHSFIVNQFDKPIRINKSPEFSKNLVRRGWMPSHQSIYLKRMLLDKYGYYNLEFHPSSDYEFFIRYFYFNDLKIKRLDKYIIKFSLGGLSTKNYINNLKAQKTQADCWDYNGEKAPLYLIPLKILRKPIQFFRAVIFRFTMMQ